MLVVISFLLFSSREKEVLNQTHVPLASYPPGTEIIIGRSSLTDPKLKSQAAFSRILDAPPASSPPNRFFLSNLKKQTKKLKLRFVSLTAENSGALIQNSAIYSFFPPFKKGKRQGRLKHNGLVNSQTLDLITRPDLDILFRFFILIFLTLSFSCLSAYFSFLFFSFPLVICSIYRRQKKDV